MADHYFQFSEVLANLTDDETAWLADQLSTIVEVRGVCYPAAALPEDIDVNNASYRGPKFLWHTKQLDLPDDTPDFGFLFLPDDGGACDARQLWFFSEEHGNLEQIALLVRKFLQAFRPKELWTATYAATCSKPRIGEFGGGAVIVTAKSMRWHDSHAIVAKAERSHARRLEAAA